MAEGLTTVLVGEEPPLCPECGAAMRLRPKGRRGPFFGCSAYPRCTGTRELTDEYAARLREEEDSESWKKQAVYWEARFWEERRFWTANAPDVRPGQTLAVLAECQCPTCGGRLG